eukprot:CAMPEP_0202448454 /NCGR_PEP_ID=MMETSP1360-20130828/7271_1 /ASSEMBLY_ACC=CAM_ASM_000848 /TAXON_ID=515479 /ORGANISM="Licmophora paradoxa, Strain CCMP2313" /LENGTH=397 /DNA_ID=CAMNT_0049066037 /DNA_START=102 /DNA_END=1295 /DNA_ORIENTATION=-
MVMTTKNRDIQVDFPVVGNGTPALNTNAAGTAGIGTGAGTRPQHFQFNYHAIAANVNAYTATAAAAAAASAAATSNMMTTTPVLNNNTINIIHNNHNNNHNHMMHPYGTGNATAANAGGAGGAYIHTHNGSINRISHLPRRSPSTSQSSKGGIGGRKTSSLAGSLESGSSLSNNNNNNINNNNMHPTPLFQRLVTEEVQELKAYARIIEQQNRRSAELERAHGDLEARLEIQSERRLELERSLEKRERTWAQQISSLEMDRDHWRDVVKMERNKNTRLMDRVAKKDQEIHRMLQRKYDLRGGGSASASSTDGNRNLNHNHQVMHNHNGTGYSTLMNQYRSNNNNLSQQQQGISSSSSPLSMSNFQSPNEWLMANETGEQSVRHQQVVDTLGAFFGGQ